MVVDRLSFPVAYHCATRLLPTHEREGADAVPSVLHFADRFLPPPVGGSPKAHFEWTDPVKIRSHGGHFGRHCGRCRQRILFPEEGNSFCGGARASPVEFTKASSCMDVPMGPRNSQALVGAAEYWSAMGTMALALSSLPFSSTHFPRITSAKHVSFDEDASRGERCSTEVKITRRV